MFKVNSEVIIEYKHLIYMEILKTMIIVMLLSKQHLKWSVKWNKFCLKEKTF